MVSLAGTWEHLVASGGTQFPKRGLNLGPLSWEHKVLATGPPGKSHLVILHDMTSEALPTPPKRAGSLPKALCIPAIHNVPSLLGTALPAALAMLVPRLLLGDETRSY